MRTSHRRRTVAATAGLAACALVAAPLAASAAVDNPIVYPGTGALELTPLGTHETGVFDESAAEIVQPWGDRLFVVDALAGAVTVLDYADPESIVEEFVISSDGVANSVAIREDGLGVIAFEDEVKTDPGHLVFFDASAADAASAYLGEVTVGALPDMVTITDDGSYAVVANEGEPDDDYEIDPEGSISVVKLHPTKVRASAQGLVRTADFHAFEEGGRKDLPADVRIFGEFPHDDYPVSRNLEPEYITTDGSTAYVTLQEANAIAVVNLKNAKVDDVWALGVKDHSVAGLGLDPSDRDPEEDASTIDIRAYEGLYGMYMPDAIDSYTVGGQTYLVTANEGDAREWGDYVEPVRVKDLEDDGFGPVCASLSAANGVEDITDDAELGRLNVTFELGFDETAGCYTELYAFGSRSFSIWTTDGELVFDSGESFEQITAAAAPESFNSNHSESNFEGRSEDKGPEPESVAIGEIDGSIYAFIGFERVGGIAVFDITDPTAGEFVTYINNRDFSVSMEGVIEDAEDLAEAQAEEDGITDDDVIDGLKDEAAAAAIAQYLPQAGDLGPEGIAFIPAADSPNGEPLIAVGNEVSGTTTVFAID